MKNTLRIHAQWIIATEEMSVLEDHALVIEEDRIIAILPSKEAKERYPSSQEITYASHAITPGLINSHTHMAMNLFRGLADDLELMDWLNHHIWPAEKKWVSEAFVYDASMLAIAEMIRCGTTCFNDMYFFLEATAKAAEIAGIRAHIGMHIIGVPTAFAHTVDDYFDKGLQFYHHYKNHPLITPTMAPHSTYTLSLDDLIRAKSIADEYKLKTNIHLQESDAEIQQSLRLHGKRPLQRLHDIGMVTPDLIAIHMTQINDDDMAILQATRPTLVHCPESNLKLASGAAPVAAFTDAGLTVALGTDGAASNNDLDMIGEMRTAAFLGKMTSLDPKALPATQVLTMATLNGAKALGIDSFTGSLKVGNAADFIAIDLDFLETQPVYHPISQIVYAATRNQVTDVWVGGKQLLKNRQLLTLDEKELRLKAQIWRKKIKN